MRKPGVQPRLIKTTDMPMVDLQLLEEDPSSCHDCTGSVHGVRGGRTAHRWGVLVITR